MPQAQNHPPGSFCWAEVGTVQTARTKAFYSELFGWTFEDRPAGQFGVYTMCKLDGKDLAGLYEMPPELVKAGLPPHWMSYVAVESADEACRTIAQHGGKIQQGPFDVMDVGRMAICQDPTGATFSIWQPKAHKGSAVMGDHGTPSWFELGTRDIARAETFYTSVFGWKIKKGADAGPVYHEFTAGGLPQGGIKELEPEQGPIPPHWLIYFTVEDCNGDVERAQRLGGRVVVPAMDIPNVGRFAVLSDPAGANFAIIQLAFDPQAKPAAKAEVPAAKSSKPAKKKKKS